MAQRLPDGDPRAVLRDHGLWEEIDHPTAQKHFEEACKVGNVEAVRAYVALGIDVNGRTNFTEMTPLIHAAAHDQCEVVRVLAAAGAELDGRDSSGRTALMTAIQHSHPAVLRTLLEVGASPDVPDNGRDHPLVEALESGDPELIAIMLSSNASVTAGCAGRSSALHWCLSRRDGARLRELLARPDADPNLSSGAGFPLLHLAVDGWNADAVEALLDAGADPHRTNRWGWNPREVAVEIWAEHLATRFEQLGVPLNLERSIAYFHAIVRGERETVIQMLDEGLELETRDPRGLTGFLRAVRAGNWTIAELLRDRGADIDAVDPYDHNALSRVDVEPGRKWLLQLDVAASFRDRHGKLRQPGLEAVLEDDDPELLRILLGARNLDLSDLSNCRRSLIEPDIEDRLDQRANTLRTLGAAEADLELVDDNGSSLLFEYIKLGFEPCVMALLELGVDIEREDDGFATPLIESCDADANHEVQARITAALLARGADPTKVDWLSRTAWDCADMRENGPCMALLEQAFEQQRIDALAEHGLAPDTDPESLDPAVFATLARRCDRESFRHWIRKSEHALVRGLLRAGFDPTSTAFDQHGLPPDNVVLCTAVVAGDEQMVDILLEHGADPNITEWSGGTVIDHAAGNHGIEIVRRLLAAGAHVDVCDKDGRTPMSEAAGSGDVEIMQVLYEAGATVQPRASGILPLWEAARWGELEAVQWLLAHEADIDARNQGRVTALLTAIEHDHVEVALALIAAGADVDVQTSDAHRNTALILAAKNGHAELVRALLDAGADTSPRDAEGKSAIDYLGREV